MVTAIVTSVLGAHREVTMEGTQGTLCPVASPCTTDLADLLTVPVTTYVTRECTQL